MRSRIDFVDSEPTSLTLSLDRMNLLPAPHSHIRVAMNREGALLTFFMLALAGSAIYSGKNALILLFCCISAAIVIFYILARNNLKQNIVVQRRFVQELYAGRETRIEFIIQNQGNQPVYGLHFFEMFENGEAIGPMFVKRLMPGESVIAHYMCTFPIRGNAHFCGVEIRSRFPLPFIELRSSIQLDETLTVFPMPLHSTHLLHFIQTRKFQTKQQLKRKNFTIRELVHGRKTGRILWKLSARKQTLIEQTPRFSIRNSTTPVLELIDKSKMEYEKFELQVSQITGFILDQIQMERAGELRIQNNIYPYGNSPDQRRIILETLATI